MVPYVRKLVVARLPAATRNRLVQCIAGHGTPRPIWAQPVELDGRWKFLVIAGLVMLLVMALIHGHEPLGVPWLAGWALACISVGLGMASWWRQRRIAARLPFPAGKYLFATELIDATDGTCRIYDLDCLTGLRVAGVVGKNGVGEGELQFVFGREVQGMRSPAKAAAEQVRHKLEAVRNTLAEVTAAQMWDSLAALDPLYEARYGGAWEQMWTPAEVRWSSLAAAVPGKFSLPPAVLGWGLAAGLMFAPALWWMDNVLRDELAFSAARSSATVGSFKRYLQRDEARHSAEVSDELLPGAAWRAAQASGSVQALREFIAKYPRSSFAKKARAQLHDEYAKAIESAKKENGTPAGEALAGLLRWMEAHGTSVAEVRFGYRWEPSVSRLEDILRLIQLELRARRAGVEVPSIAPGFSKETVRRREDAVIRSLQEGFEKIVPGGLLELRRGGGFSGKPVGFEAPALTVQWAADLPGAKTVEPVEGDDGKVYLQLMFQFEVELVVPGAPPFNFQFEMTPGDPLSGVAAGKSQYEAMADLAFDEMDQQLAAKFFPRHTPPRKFAVASPRPARPPADPNQPVATATGFCISRSGYIVTAQHFTRGAREFKVVTKAGLVPADLVRSDPANDMAVLKIRGGFPAALGIRSSRTVKLGEAVATIGFPNMQVQGQEPKVTDGKISSLAGMQDDPGNFQVSVPIQPGNSGGPLLDTQGNVIGIIVARLASPNSQNVNYAVKSSLLLSFLESLPQLNDAPAPLTGEPPKFEDMVERVKQATVLIVGFGDPPR